MGFPFYDRSTAPMRNVVPCDVYICLWAVSYNQILFKCYSGVKAHNPLAIRSYRYIFYGFIYSWHLEIAMFHFASSFISPAPLYPSIHQHRIDRGSRSH